MSRDEIFKRVVNALNALQIASGRAPVDIKGTTSPIGGLSGFDSHAGLELACELEVQLEIEIPLDENVCVDDAKNCARNVDQIVDRLLEIQKGS